MKSQPARRPFSFLMAMASTVLAIVAIREAGRGALSNEADQDHFTVQRRLDTRRTGAAARTANMNRLGQSVIVENRPGADTAIATELPPHPHPMATLCCRPIRRCSTRSIRTPATFLDSFAPVAALAAWSHVLVVPPSIPANNLSELIAFAKANPGQLNIGFPLGQAPQVLAEISTAPPMPRSAACPIARHRRSCRI